VLVHCAAGVSRSPTLVIAYIMWSQKKTRKEAYEYVSSKRPIIDPNENFMNQLEMFEEVVNRVE
jgi:protein-tyrosine phosphatase